MYGNINNNGTNSATKMTQCTKEQQNIGFPIFYVHAIYLKTDKIHLMGKRRRKKQSKNCEFLGIERQTNRKITHSSKHPPQKHICARHTNFPSTFAFDSSLNEISNDSVPHEFKLADGKIERYTGECRSRLCKVKCSVNKSSECNFMELFFAMRVSHKINNNR